MIGIAPPVNRYEFASVKLSTKPTFVEHGEGDELTPLKLVRDGQATEVGDALEVLLTDFTCGKP